MMRAAILVRGLVKEFRGGVRALDGIDLAVPPGEVFAYLGRNGSGKTTTVRILTTLTAPTAGTVRVAGVDAVAEPAKVRRAIGATMQEAAFDPGMTGREHLRLCAGLWGLRGAARRLRADDLLELFGLTEAADRRIGEYSGGMQRRLDLATALLGTPQVLFLDEPTTGLDPQSRRVLWSQILELRHGGTTVFLTTQYTEEAERFADRVAVIDRGRLIAIGSPDELKASHGATTLEVQLVDPGRAAAALALLAATSLPRASGDESPGDGVLHLRLDGRNGTAAGVDAALQLRQAGMELARVAVHEPSIEDVFVALTGTAITASPTPAGVA